MSIPLTPEILAKIKPFHVGLGYYVIHNVETLYAAKRILTEAGFELHDKVKRPIILKRDWCTGRMVDSNYDACDIFLAGNDRCNIANYNGITKALQFFVNEEFGTFGRRHETDDDYRWSIC